MRTKGRRRVDGASALLLAVGVWCGWLCYGLITEHGYDPLILVPSVAAATTGLSNITKRQAPRPPREKQ